MALCLCVSSPCSCLGVIVVPAGGGGTFLGGYIVKRLNLRCRGIIRFCMLCALVSLLAIFIFLINCPNVPMAGITQPYHSAGNGSHVYQHQYQNQNLYLANHTGNQPLRNRCSVCAELSDWMLGSARNLGLVFYVIGYA